MSFIISILFLMVIFALLRRSVRKLQEDVVDDKNSRGEK